MRFRYVTRVLVVGVLTVVASQGPARGAETEQDALQIAFQTYCEFVEDEEWHKSAEISAALVDEAKDILVLMLTDGDDEMQLCAWMLLSDAQDARVIPSVAAFIADPGNNAGERSTACEWIMGFANLDAQAAMLSILSEPLDRDVNSGLQICAIQGLGGIDDTASRGRLEELFLDPQYAWARSTIIEARGRLRDAAIVPQLVQIVEGSSAPISEKYAAMIALAAIGTPESVEPLHAVIQSLPPGPRRYEIGTSVASRLEIAKERTQGTPFATELEQLIVNIRALALERPL